MKFLNNFEKFQNNERGFIPKIIKSVELIYINQQMEDFL